MRISLTRQRHNYILFLCQAKANRRREAEEKKMWKDVLDTVIGVGLLTLIGLVLAYWPA